MEPGVLRGIGTIILMSCFVALCVWAYSPKRRARFEEAALLPLDDDDDSRGTP